MPAAGYFDHNASTPPRPEVLRVMVEAMQENFGNPNSTHRHGVAARYAVEKARRVIARAIIAPSPETIIFTGGGSEANALALRGAAFAARRRGSGNHLIVAAAEHKAVLDAAIALRDLHGFALTLLEVDPFARANAELLRKALRKETILVSIMMANNEVGSLNPIHELATVTHEHSSALFHTDAIQCLGRVPLDVAALDIDMLTLSAHKCHGPKGVGALYRRSSVELDPLVIGGGQEFGLRAGTENVAGIVGFAEAARLAVHELPAEAPRLSQLRESLWEAIIAQVPSVLRNSPSEHCLPNTLHISLPGCESRRLVAELNHLGFSCSSGSACTSTGAELSHVLLATGADEARAAGALRLSLGRDTTDTEVRAFAVALPAACAASQVPVE